MLPPQAQTVQYRFLRLSRRLYGNQKSTLSCRSSESLQSIFETTGTIGTTGRIIWKPGLTAAQSCFKRLLVVQNRSGENSKLSVDFLQSLFPHATLKIFYTSELLFNVAKLTANYTEL